MERFIGFSPDTLTQNALRLRISFFKTGRYFFVEKPCNISLEASTAAEGESNIVAELKKNLGKNELQIFGIKTPYAVNFIDKDVSGLCLISCGKEEATYLRNLNGSELIDYEFLFLSKGDKEEKSFFIDLPMLFDKEKNRAIVSHRYGKKCSANFECLESCAGFSLWKVKTKFLRQHQVRLHAFESGLRIVGDAIYAEEPLPRLSEFKKRYKKFDDEKPLYDSIALHLASISFKDSDGENIFVKSDLGKKFKTMLSKLSFKCVDEI